MRMSKGKKREPATPAINLDDTPTLAEHLIRILGENEFYRLVALSTVPGLEQVLVGTMKRYASASKAMQRVLAAYPTLDEEQREHIRDLHSEYEGASLIALRLSYRRLLEQLEEAMTIKQPRTRTMLEVFGEDAHAFVRVISFGRIGKGEAKMLGKGE
jgi:hypothetical protein